MHLCCQEVAPSPHHSSQFGGKGGGEEEAGGGIHVVIAGSVHSAQAAHLVVHPHLFCQPSVLLAHQVPQQPVAVASAGYSHVTDCASLTEISTKTKSSSRRLEMGKRIPMSLLAG